MRNRRIIQAYDSINPSAADKQKMLDAILAQAAPEEPPRRMIKNREPVVYTAKPTKTSKRSFIGTLAASFALIVLAGFGLGFVLSRKPVQPAYESPDPQVTEPASTAADIYQPVLEKYRRALEEGWTKEQCEIEGISLRMQAGADQTKAGYAFRDLDGDGREELLIAEESLPHIDLIWDIYTTLSDGTPVQIYSDECDGTQCYLHEGNIISTEYSGKTQGDYIYHTLEKGQLILKECLQYDEDVWFYTDGDGNTKNITNKEAMDISDSYEHLKLELTWLADIPDYLRDEEMVEQYLPTLEKYRTAISEGWDGAMCSENGISFLTPIANEYDGLYYSISDLDGNGVQELVVAEHPYQESTDMDFLDIYTLRNGRAEKIMSRNEERLLRYLCEDGTVKDMSPPERGNYDTYVSFWDINQDGMYAQTGSVYQISGRWYHGFPTSEEITPVEAEAEVRSFKPPKLDFMELAAPDRAESLTGYEGYDHIISKYVTAINEGWTAHLCEQNDISPRILDETALQYNLGWCLVDIDKNGVEELVVSDGVHLFDLYCIMPHDGGPGHLIMNNVPAEHYMLCKDGTIELQTNFSKGSSWKYYRVSGWDLKLEDVLIYRNEYEGTAATEMYYYGTDEDNVRPISKDEAGNRIVDTEKTAMELDLTLFVDPAPFVLDEQEYYEPLLNIYRQAIREEWNPEQCVEQGISLMIGYYGDFVEELGYTMMDLDDNGIQELIITDGTNIYDLYTIIQDEEVGPLRLVDAMERIEYFLTTDGWIYSLGSGSASISYYTLYALEGRNLNLLEGYMMDYETDPQNPWYYYDGVDQGAPCPSSVAAAATDAIHFAHIPFTSFE